MKCCRCGKLLRKNNRKERSINMPGLDKTGPRGKGPRTGGGFGICSPDEGVKRRKKDQDDVLDRLGLGRGGRPRGLGRRGRGGRRPRGRGFGRNR
jgi:hypothetical protein